MTRMTRTTPSSTMHRPIGSLLFTALAALAIALAAACGGKQTQPERPGDTQTSERGAGEEGMEGEDGEATDASEGEAGEEGETGEGETQEDQGPPPAVTFVLKNSDAVQELAFNMDLGWQPNLFAYRGKPPKAVSILMFPKFCTESCEASDEDRCPTCPQPEKTQDILAAQKLEKVLPGDELEVPWDGKMFVYEKTRAGKARCECHSAEPAPEGTYTVKACGLRLTTTAEERSRLQCAEAEMTLPAEEPLRVELDFGTPAPPPGAKKARKKRR
jgi:hypothetical protein